jgi:hypothetical protein
LIVPRQQDLGACFGEPQMAGVKAIKEADQCFFDLDADILNSG